MRVAFDLDETLVPISECFPTEAPSSRLFGWLSRERLRVGAPGLLRGLVRDGHEVWVYTTSLRSTSAVNILFRVYGVRLSGVVNADRHREAIRGKTFSVRSPSKYPPAFGIDVLIDNSEGVEAEGAALGFRVIRVSPDDAGWTERVLAYLPALSPGLRVG